MSAIELGRGEWDDNHYRPHSHDLSGDYMAPVAFAVGRCSGPGSTTLRLPQNREGEGM